MPPRPRPHRRFFRTGELPLVLLALLARRPQHGYDLMAELDRCFGPSYRPSPGSIYPALAALESEGLVEGTTGADRRTYVLTRSGRVALKARGTSLAEIESRTGAHLTSTEALQPALDRFVARVRDVASDLDAGTLTRFLDETANHIERLERQEDPE